MVGRSLGNTRDDNSGRAVTHENHFVQTLECQPIDDVADVYVEARIGAREMTAFTESRERGSDYVVPLC